jgi:hypothetical protein
LFVFLQCRPEKPTRPLTLNKDTVWYGLIVCTGPSISPELELPTQDSSNITSTLHFGESSESLKDHNKINQT